MVCVPHQDESALSSKGILSNPLAELSLISLSTHIHYSRKQTQVTLVKIRTWEKETVNLILHKGSLWTCEGNVS